MTAWLTSRTLHNSTRLLRHHSQHHDPNYRHPRHHQPSFSQHCRGAITYTIARTSYSFAGAASTASTTSFTSLTCASSLSRRFWCSLSSVCPLPSWHYLSSRRSLRKLSCRLLHSGRSIRMLPLPSGHCFSPCRRVLHRRSSWKGQGQGRQIIDRTYSSWRTLRLIASMKSSKFRPPNVMMRYSSDLPTCHSIPI